MNCSKCKDGFITSALLGRVACLACRDSRIDGCVVQSKASIKIAVPDGSTDNPLGRRPYDRVYITEVGFAVWVAPNHSTSSCLLPDGGGTYPKLLDTEDTATSGEFRTWFFGEDRIGGYRIEIDVSHEFGAGAVASIDEQWKVRLCLACSTESEFKLTDDTINGRRFRRAIKLPEPMHVRP